MVHSNRWTVFILIPAAALLSACAQAPGAMYNIDPATVEEIEGSAFKRVTVTERAAERLDIQVAVVRQEQVVRSQTVVAEVVANQGAPIGGTDLVWVRVPGSVTDIRMVARDLPAVMRSLEDEDDDDEQEESDEWKAHQMAELDEALGLDDDEEQALYYVADAGKAPLEPGERVFLTLPLMASEAALKIIPYSALIYDTQGGTFVYVSEPGGLSFVRHEVLVAFIEGDLAYLLAGPPEGTQVVSQGVAELYGAETGISK